MQILSALRGKGPKKKVALARNGHMGGSSTRNQVRGQRPKGRRKEKYKALERTLSQKFRVLFSLILLVRGWCPFSILALVYASLTAGFK